MKHDNPELGLCVGHEVNEVLIGKTASPVWAIFNIQAQGRCSVRMIADMGEEIYFWLRLADEPLPWRRPGLVVRVVGDFL